MVIDLADPRKQNPKLTVGKPMKNPIYPEGHQTQKLAAPGISVNGR